MFGPNRPPETDTGGFPRTSADDRGLDMLCSEIGMAPYLNRQTKFLLSVALQVKVNVITVR